MKSALQFLDTLPVTCPLRRATGLKCAFCGMTHAFLHLFAGEWSAAAHENFLSLPLLIILLVSPYWIIRKQMPPRIALWILICVFAGYAIVRNLPGFQEY